MTDATRLRFFIAVNPGLEPWLADEITALGLSPQLRAGGVEVSGSFKDLVHVCIHARLAESVRVRLKAFKATGFEKLESQLQRLPWHAYLRADLSTHISVTCHRSRLYHSDAVLERCQRAIEHTLKSPLVIATRAEAKQTVFVRLDRDEVEASIDASGELLHRRGYRIHVADAPLRETLAASLVRIANANNASTMWDPFCGSGTLILEWLIAAQDHTPTKRGFAFEQWPTFRSHADAFAEALAAQPTYAQGMRHAYGSDLSDRAIEATRNNAEHLGAREDITLHAIDFSEASQHIPRGSAIIANPPYGKRLGDNREVMQLHRRFEQMLKQRRDLRPVVMACGFAPFLSTMTLPWKRVLSTKNGGLNITILRLD